MRTPGVYVWDLRALRAKRATTTTTNDGGGGGGDEEKKEERGGANAETAVRYLHEGLTVSDKLLREAKNEERMATLNQGKLFLVLDLDHTLLNSCRFDELNDEERDVG